VYEKITTAIEKHTRTHRLVFWYDPDGAHRSVLDSLSVDAAIVEIDNDELAIKRRLLLDEPDRHFLVYAPYPRPADEHNWLLDLILAGFPFSTDLAETYREELGLDVSLRSFVAAHAAFFENRNDRVEPLAELIDPEGETEESLALKMISVLVGPDAEARRSPERVQWSLFGLIDEAVAGERDRWDMVRRYELDGAWRSAVGRYVADVSDDIEPGGAAIEIFRNAWDAEREATPSRYARNCWYLLGEWRGRFWTGGRYARVVEWVQEAIGVGPTLAGMTMEHLRRSSVFPLIDREIAGRLIGTSSDDHPDWQLVRAVARERLETFWVQNHLPALRAVYTLLEDIVAFEHALAGADLSGGDAATLIQRYTSSLYRVDQLYRRILAAYTEAESPGAIAELVARIEGRYVHQFLQPLVEVWDHASLSDAGMIPLQTGFFDGVVAHHLRNDEKLVVIISDALRYEAGEELSRRITALNRTQVELEPMIAAAPTVTRVGMSALLPHTSIRLTGDGVCLIDDRNVQGIDARAAYLVEAVERRFPGKRAGAFKVADILPLSTAVARERFGGLDVVYLYSDSIDATADNAKTEHLMASAAEDELNQLVTMVRKLGSQLNRTHAVITADHGFLYQRDPLVEAHKITAEKTADGVRERRFILGSGAEAVAEDGGTSYRTVTGDPGLVPCDVPIVFASGLSRIRKQGGGNRYVHGGLSLQERIVPLIRVRISRTDDVEPVSVSLMKPANAVITTPTYTVRFFQEQPVSEKRPAVFLVAWFRGVQGRSISDTAEIVFDSTDPADQNRGRAVEFHFGPDAVQSNGHNITLVLERKVGGARVVYAEESFRYQTIGERDF
jgi:uncharacterized protein (TIGR02687 family)